MAERTKNRWVIVAVVAAFAAPLVAAIWLNSRWSEWAPGQTRNHGVLIMPVVALPSDLIEPLGPSRQWTLVQLGQACRPQCAKTYQTLVQTHRSLGRLSEKLALITLAPSATHAPAPKADQLDQFFAQRWPNDSALLIDPLGNAMMRYPAGFDPSGLRKDLERLLKYSKIQ